VAPGLLCQEPRRREGRPNQAREYVARQFNPGGASDDGLVKNNGGDLWCPGVKHEGKGVRFATSYGVRMEMPGWSDYQGSDESDARPLSGTTRRRSA